MILGAAGAPIFCIAVAPSGEPQISFLLQSPKAAASQRWRRPRRRSPRGQEKSRRKRVFCKLSYNWIYVKYRKGFLEEISLCAVRVGSANTVDSIEVETKKEGEIN